MSSVPFAGSRPIMQMPLLYRRFFKEEDDEELPGGPFWGDRGAGVLIVAKDTGRFLIFLRSDSVNDPNTWNLVGGKVDSGETFKDAAIRELNEETGYRGEYKLKLLHIFRHKDFRYYNFLCVVPFEFTPQLNWEHDTSKWVDYGDWPSPLHFGLTDVIRHMGPRLERLSSVIKQRSAKLSGVRKEAIDTPPAIVQPSASHTAPYNMTNAYVVAATLWGEARGEGEQGIQAVLNVIMNRAKDNFGKARDVVLMPHQFEVWQKVSDPEAFSLNLARQNRDDRTYQKIIRLVDRAASGKLPDITGGALFYFNPKNASPSWAKKMQKTATIGHHEFYKPLQTKKKMKENIDDCEFTNQGLVDDGVYGYEMKSKTSRLSYGYEPTMKIFYLYSVATPNEEDKNKGHSKRLLEDFFQLIKQYGGSLDIGPYTTSGMSYVKHVVERLSKQYNIPLVKGRNFYDLS